MKYLLIVLALIGTVAVAMEFQDDLDGKGRFVWENGKKVYYREVSQPVTNVVDNTADYSAAWGIYQCQQRYGITNADYLANVDKSLVIVKQYANEPTNTAFWVQCDLSWARDKYVGLRLEGKSLLAILSAPPITTNITTTNIWVKAE